ncbi:M24 family metallopeptidase [Corynebacterium glutamicum]|uniref:M24 family metallopeptidase n=1 Tax=Corynebacterium glutamicum TaxID=1718 RepID=UPI000744BE12|nr:M24 family metallopeptidase [Corynebacterium glutamicum]ALZ99222.1 Xaa-Pro aminopeptidase [Corynebacterium glutamicum]
MHLTSNPARLKELFNLDAQKSLLFSAIRLDSHPLVAPIIATVKDQDPILLVRQQEQGNIFSSGVPRNKIRFYAPWVTIDDAPLEGVEAASSLQELIKELADETPVCFAPDIAYAHYLVAQDQVQIAVESLSPEAIDVVELEKGLVEKRFADWRRAGVEEAKKLVSGIAHLEGLDQELDRVGADTRFELLQEIASQHALSAIYVASPPNFSEITGMAATEGASVLWSADTQSVFLFLPQGAPAPEGSEAVGSFGSVSEAVALLIGEDKAVGVEEEFIGTALALSLTEGEIIPIQTELGHWRDVRDSEDLPFQVIASRTSVTIMENTLEWTNNRLERGEEFTELDIYAHYLEELEDYALQFTFDVEPYFTNLHSSNRMLFPGPPVDFPINAETRCIQLDAGVAVKKDGVVLGTSDMARSLPRTAAGQEAYEYFFKVVREGIIGQLRPGVICADVHEATLDYLSPQLPRMIDIGMLGADTDFNTIYRKRNVGHLMGKQESFANELRPGYKHILHHGSYGAAEIPWRYNGVAIGTEDLWYIGADKTYILSQR